jgi:hypothetical protein
VKKRIAMPKRSMSNSKTVGMLRKREKLDVA